MALEYYRRFRMELDFAKVHLPEPILPDRYHCIPWHALLLSRHALVKFESFRSEIDSRIFPCLGELGGCQRLMHEISSQNSFLPGTTWLITYDSEDGTEPVDCGTIQGAARSKTVGAVQNIGVIPEQRGYGLGRALLLKALDGFRSARMRRVYLEVTAENRPAVNLYRSIGFCLTRTMYKAVEVEEAHAY